METNTAAIETNAAAIETNTDAISQLSEEIQELKENSGSGSGGVVETTKTGDIVTVTPVTGTVAKVVSKIVGQDTGWRNSNKIQLAHIGGENLLDITTACGGAGTTFVAAGITATINADCTMTLNGTYTHETAYVDLFLLTGKFGYFVFPAGTYTVTAGMTVSIASPDKTWTSLGTKRNTFTVDKPFFVYTAKYVLEEGNAFNNAVIPLGMVVGEKLPSSGFEYVGNVYEANFTSAITDGEFDWETGQLKDADGNLIETVSAHGEFNVYDGKNVFITSNGQTTASVSVATNVNAGGVDSDAVKKIVEDALKFDTTVWNLPVLELTGDTTGMTKDDAVDLAYVYGDLSGTCSVKWQGSSSIRYAKKNYTIKFDNAFEAKDGWGEQKKYCFKANYIDHSHARNVVNAKLWGQIVKSRSDVPTELASLPNAGAVDGFPCIITLNGEFHGLYTFNIPKDGWMFGMGNGPNEAILCADKHVAATRFKAEAVADGNDFKLEYVSDENNDAWVVPSINRLINACINSDGADLDTTVAQYIDWQSVIDYYIFTVMITGDDMTDKNYLLATFDGTKWYFSAYDMDCTYGLFWDGSTFVQANASPSFTSYASMHRAMELVKAYKKEELKARYAQLRAGVLSESNLATVFANFTGAIASPVYMEDAKKWPMIPNTSTNNISQIRDYYRMRCEIADKWMEDLQ